MLVCWVIVVLSVDFEGVREGGKEWDGGGEGEGLEEWGMGAL